MRKGTWVLLLLMTACLLGGCSKESAEQTEITLIHGWGLHGIGACQNAADL